MLSTFPIWILDNNYNESNAYINFTPGDAETPEAALDYTTPFHLVTFHRVGRQK